MPIEILVVHLLLEGGVCLRLRLSTVSLLAWGIGGMFVMHNAMVACRDQESDGFLSVGDTENLLQIDTKSRILESTCQE